MAILVKNREITINAVAERQKTVKAFMEFVDTNSIFVSNFKFNREDCYA